MKSMGRYKCQVTVSTLSAIILVLCFVIMSYQVSYIIDIFYQIVEKYMSFALYDYRILIQFRLNNVFSLFFL